MKTLSKDDLIKFIDDNIEDIIKWECISQEKLNCWYDVDKLIVNTVIVE